MNPYETQAATACKLWQQDMVRKPGVFNALSKLVQTKVNSWIPEKVHKAITLGIKQMMRAVLFGARHTAQKLIANADLYEREIAVEQRIKLYKNTAAAEGGITGAGGILLGLADFPLLMGIKIKLLFDIAALYGFDTNDYKERVYLLHIFELAFSSDSHRKDVFLKMENWEEKSLLLPDDIHQFDWRNFQQEYRDYIDLAKMAQLVPFIGAPVGVVVNYSLIKKLGHTAMNAYRMRIFDKISHT